MSTTHLFRAAVVFFILAPATILWFKPEWGANPLVSFLLSGGLAAVSILASRDEVLGTERRRTQTEWLSQAESACDRLLTTCAQVLRLRERASCTCDNAVKSLPELQEDQMRPIRALIEQNCQNTADQLRDVATHLESAVDDWKRFIRKTCEGAECEAIGRELERRRLKLWADFPNNAATNCSSTEDQAAEVATGTTPAASDLA